MYVMIDNYDSFVYNLVRYFEELDQDIKVYRNDEITVKELEELAPEGIILSPGPKSPKEAGNMLEIIDYFKGQVPILGICLGYQGIVDYFGGEIIEGTEPMHGKISPIHHDGSGLFKGLHNPLNVTRYHSLIADANTLPETLAITAKTSDGVIMGVRHKTYPIFGVQFHPEAELTEEGHVLLRNFLKWENIRGKLCHDEIKSYL